MSDLAALLATMTPEQLSGATLALDAVSRPMQPREIELLLRAKGVSVSRAKIVTAAVKNCHLIALLGPEDHRSDRCEPTRTVVEVKRRVLPRRTQ